MTDGFQCLKAQRTMRGHLKLPLGPWARGPLLSRQCYRSLRANCHISISNEHRCNADVVVASTTHPPTSAPLLRVPPLSPIGIS